MARSAPSLSPELAARIRLVCFDVDGVLTDGGIVLGDAAGSRVELKRYDIQDGMGITLLHQAGIRTAIITGRESESVTLRGRELGIEDVIQDRYARKVPALDALLVRRAISWGDTAFVGDDLPDLGVMRRVGLPVAVGNASPEVQRAATLQLVRHGGHGAVREFCEVLLQARGDWDTQVERYVASRMEPA